MTHELDQALRGVIPPVVTPLHPGGTLDEEGFDRQVRRCRAAGCTGVFVAGSSGEGPWLTESSGAGSSSLARRPTPSSWPG